MSKWGKVIDITEVQKVAATGELETWYRYRVTTPLEVTFTELISEADVKAGKVEAILSAKAALLDKTKSP